MDDICSYLICCLCLTLTRRWFNIHPTTGQYKKSLWISVITRSNTMGVLSGTGYLFNSFGIIAAEHKIFRYRLRCKFTSYTWEWLPVVYFHHTLCGCMVSAPEVYGFSPISWRVCTFVFCYNNQTWYINHERLINNRLLASFCQCFLTKQSGCWPLQRVSFVYAYTIHIHSMDLIYI